MLKSQTACAWSPSIVFRHPICLSSNISRIRLFDGRKILSFVIWALTAIGRIEQHQNVTCTRVAVLQVTHHLIPLIRRHVLIKKSFTSCWSHIRPAVLSVDFSCTRWAIRFSTTWPFLTSVSIDTIHARNLTDSLWICRFGGIHNILGIYLTTLD